MFDKKEYGRQWRAKHVEHNRQWYLKHQLYRVWTELKRRCLNPTDKDYPHYGGRGITICSEWLDYKTFESWALSRCWQKGLTIDRINNDGNYEPDNCWFLPMSIHAKKSNGKPVIEVMTINL
jgi:hypothetical protein